MTRAERIARRLRRRQLRHWLRHDHKRWHTLRTLELLGCPPLPELGIGHWLSVKFVEVKMGRRRSDGTMTAVF